MNIKILSFVELIFFRKSWTSSTNACNIWTLGFPPTLVFLVDIKLIESLLKTVSGHMHTTLEPFIEILKLVHGFLDG